MKAAEISPMRLNPTSTVKVDRRRLVAGIVLMEIVRMAVTAVDAADGPAAVVGIVDAAGAVDGLVAADGIADAADRVGEGTRNLCHGFARIHTDITKGHGIESWPFSLTGLA